MDDQSSKPTVCACVLAAGTSTRFGDTKLVQPFRGSSLIQYALHATRDACGGSVYLVVGHDQESVVEASAGLCDNIVVNNKYQDGIGSSIAAGVRACSKNSAAILIVLADQPLVTAAHLKKLIATWSGDDREIVASTFDGNTGPPILFPEKTFDALSELSGDSGAKKLLQNNAFVVRSVEFPAARLDVDTPEDLRRLAQDYDLSKK